MMINYRVLAKMMLKTDPECYDVKIRQILAIKQDKSCTNKTQLKQIKTQIDAKNTHTNAENTLVRADHALPGASSEAENVRTSGKTADKVAQACQVSTKTIESMRTILRYGSTGTIHDLFDKNISLSEAFKQAKSSKTDYGILRGSRPCTDRRVSEIPFVRLLENEMRKQYHTFSKTSQKDITTFLGGLVQTLSEQDLVSEVEKKDLQVLLRYSARFEFKDQFFMDE